MPAHLGRDWQAFRWNDLLYPLLVTSSDSIRPIQVAVSLLVGGYSTDYSLIATGLFLSSLPIIIAYLIGQQYFIKGVALTGIK